MRRETFDSRRTLAFSARTLDCSCPGQNSVARKLRMPANILFGRDKELATVDELVGGLPERGSALLIQGPPRDRQVLPLGPRCHPGPELRIHGPQGIRCTGGDPSAVRGAAPADPDHDGAGLASPSRPGGCAAGRLRHGRSVPQWLRAPVLHDRPGDTQPARRCDRRGPRSAPRPAACPPRRPHGVAGQP